MSVQRLQALARQYQLELVILFGSRAKGTPRPGSDTDIAVLRREGIVPPEEVLELTYRLGRTLGMPNPELVDLRRAPPLLKYEVARSGKVLYEAEPGLFQRFHILAWKLYQDDRIRRRGLDRIYLERALQRLLS